MSFTGQVATSGGFLVRPLAEPSDGIVVTSLTSPQKGANSRFYVALQDTRNVTLTGASTTMINGSFTFCTLDFCPERRRVCSPGQARRARWDTASTRFSRPT